MTKTYLFDWGDTLMIDFPDAKGKMCDWEYVETVDGAFEALEFLSRTHDIYIATNAADSAESDIEKAFVRVGLSQFIRGYFCFGNLGVTKGTPEFFHRIVDRLSLNPNEVTMVGDNLENDIIPAIEAGLNAIWLCRNGGLSLPYSSISSLRALITEKE